MHLKSLVLKGFKSFADRTAITLEPGITAIVGPNGSGKSNISDAVLWVLGERNAKNLRGQAMEDVIFAGSSARRGVGLAEVDLVLDNADMTLPVDYSEVSLTRRMYRSGESEYLINGAPARRLDFMDILHDTGLGTGVHSVIGQGNLDAILASSPQERCALVEEAAGVLKHKQRKQRSARKIAAMDEHLARVKDVAAEVERQLKPLARKAARAEAHRALAAELEAVELALAVDDVRALQKRWEAAESCEKKACAAIEAAQLHLDEVARASQDIQALFQRQSLDASEAAQRIARLHMLVERFESANMLLAEKARGIEARVSAARETLSGSARRIERCDAEMAALQEKIDVERARRDEAGAALDELSALCDAAACRCAAADARLSEARSLSRQAQQDADAAAADRSALQEGLSRHMSAESVCESKRAAAAAELGEARDELARCDRSLECDEARLEELAERKRIAHEALDAVLNDVDEARAQADAARRAVADVESRIAALAALDRASREENEAAAWVFSHAKDLDASGACAASLIKAPRELERLVEFLLADDADAWCATDADRAADIASALFDSGAAGSASIIFEDDGSRAPRFACENRLIERLEYPDAMASALEALIGDVVLVDTFAEAIARAKDGDARLRYVSEDGVVVRPGAKIAMGRICDVGDGALARERELGESRSALAEAREAQVAAEARCRLLDADLESRRAASLEASKVHAEHAGATESLRSRRGKLARRIEALEAALASCESESAAAKRAIAEARNRAEVRAARIEDLPLARAPAEGLMAQASRERDDARLEEQDCAGRRAEAKLKHATAAERLRSLEREYRARRAERERAERASARATSDVRSLEAAAGRIVHLGEALDSLKASADMRAQAQAQGQKRAQRAVAELSSAMERSRRDAAEAQERLDAAKAALGEARVEKGKVEVQVESAVASIVEGHGISLESALETPATEDRAAAEGQAAGLRRRLRAIGAIDSSAAAEYAAMKERYDFLAGQIEDVEAARRALKRIVSAIDARMKERFDDAFARVDGNFRSIFAQLFPGGSGWLSLVELDDEGALGMEVHAQPRGKRISKMTLMSGGEKSLVAIALLFAVYGIRRTPFYILDEVEAALDDSNLRRLLAYLETLRGTTQLIMITHQRRTMEMADVLYGISMQADGVTKAVSQRLDRASGRPAR